MFHKKSLNKIWLFVYSNKIECILRQGTSLETSNITDKKYFIQNMPKLNKPIVSIENIKSYANKINCKVPFGNKFEPNILFDVHRSEIRKGEIMEELKDSLKYQDGIYKIVSDKMMDIKDNWGHQ